MNVHCRYCAGLLEKRDDRKWWHIGTSARRCVDLLGAQHNARPTRTYEDEYGSDGP